MKHDYIKKLIRILENSKIDSIQLSSFWGMNKIKLFKSSQIVRASEETRLSPAPTYPEEIKVDSSKNNEVSKNNDIEPSSEDLASKESENVSSWHDIKAPLVGTLYFSPKPGEPPFIKIGDKIEPGQILCIIEAMKIFNEIESEISGKIVKVLVDDNTPVEFDQPLFLVDPS